MVWRRRPISQIRNQAIPQDNKVDPHLVLCQSAGYRRAQTLEPDSSISEEHASIWRKPWLQVGDEVDKCRLALPRNLETEQKPNRRARGLAAHIVAE